MTEENFFEQIKEEQQKQQARLSALQKILDATLIQNQNNSKKESIHKRIKKMSDFFGAEKQKKNKK